MLEFDLIWRKGEREGFALIFGVTKVGNNEHIVPGKQVQYLHQQLQAIRGHVTSGCS